MNRTPAVLGLLALTLPVALDMRPVAAETYRPWCLHDSDKAATSCAYSSYDQCMMTARGGGGMSAEPMVSAVRRARPGVRYEKPG